MAPAPNPANPNAPRPVPSQPPYPGSYAQSLVDDIGPFVERTYRVYTDKSHRAIAGLSMGAMQTVIVANNNPNLFDYIGGRSPDAMIGSFGGIFSPTTRRNSSSSA